MEFNHIFINVDKYKNLTNISEIEQIPLCEMSYDQRLFLYQFLQEYKPQKVIELGVSAGGSSSLILQTISKWNGHLYSIDVQEKYYRNPQKDTGFVVKEKYPELQKYWTLYIDENTSQFMDKIGDNIDLAFIDTAHVNPGEILDFLMVLPYLKENAIILFHDTTLSLRYRACYTNAALMSSISGKKYLLEQDNTNILKPKYGNIGAIKINSKTRENIFDIFNLLLMPWEYMLSETQYNSFLAHFSKFYEKDLVNIFEKCYLFNKRKQEIITEPKKTTDKSKNRINKLYKNLKMLLNLYID